MGYNIRMFETANLETYATLPVRKQLINYQPGGMYDFTGRKRGASLVARKKEPRRLEVIIPEDRVTFTFTPTPESRARVAERMQARKLRKQTLEQQKEEIVPQ